MMSPSLRRTGLVTRSSPRIVPFLLPKSSSVVSRVVDRPGCGDATPLTRPAGLRVGVASDHVLAVDERRKRREMLFKPAGWWICRVRRRVCLNSGVAAEHITNPCRSDVSRRATIAEPRGSRRRVQRLASATKVSGQSAAIPPWTEPLAALDKGHEEIEGFGREVISRRDQQHRVPVSSTKGPKDACIKTKGE